VKTEPGTAPPTTTDAVEPNAATLLLLKSDAKKVLRGIAETVTTLKEMHVNTNTKYTAELNVDVGKLLPRYAKIYKTIEEIHLKKISDVPTLTVVARKIDEANVEFTNMHDWYERLNGKNGGKKRKVG
jgi:hypothetical protein